MWSSPKVNKKAGAKKMTPKKTLKLKPTIFKKVSKKITPKKKIKKSVKQAEIPDKI